MTPRFLAQGTKLTPAQAHLYILRRQALNAAVLFARPQNPSERKNMFTVSKDVSFFP